MVWIALEEKYDHPNKINKVKQSYYFFYYCDNSGCQGNPLVAFNCHKFEFSCH